MESQPLSPFWRLSSDLRNQIYEPEMPDHDIIRLNELSEHNALTRTCSQIRAATHKLFYGNKYFVMHSCTMARLTRFITAIRVETFCSIDCFRFAWDEIQPRIVGYRNAYKYDADFRTAVTTGNTRGFAEPYLLQTLEDLGLDVEEVEVPGMTGVLRLWIVSPHKKNSVARGA